jgi:flagellar basal-body rod protein FlgB
MWIDRLLASKTTQAVELSAAYAEQRHRVLAENLANIDTPGYQSQVLDPAAFQKTLQTALDRTAGTNNDRLELRGDAQCSTDSDGRLEVKPAVEPAPNVLFHDGTNAKLEKLVAEINENALSYEMSTNLLRGRYQTMLAAIRGRMA